MCAMCKKYKIIVLINVALFGKMFLIKFLQIIPGKFLIYFFLDLIKLLNCKFKIIF